MDSKPSKKNHQFAQDVINEIVAWFRASRLSKVAMFFLLARNVTESYHKLKINNEITNYANQ